MHFALPPRKTSNPPPYAVRNTRNSFSFSAFRRKRLQAVGLAALGALSILWLITSLLHDGIFSGNPRPPAGVPEVAIVTLIDDEGSSADYIEKIKQNRIDYAARHGYATFFPNMSDYALDSAPKTWAMIPALRHATTKFPQTQWLFSISQHALIMNPALSISSHITNPSRLSTLMKRDHPVVPPDSVIHTFSHLLPRQIDLIISQDGESLSHGSFLLRNWGGIDARGKREGGDWAKFFLDTWYNPLYRSYNFQKAEGHALEHIIQWHPTLLAKLALVPQHIINSYSSGIVGGATTELFSHNDFVIRLSGCENNATICEREMTPFYTMWDQKVKSLD